MDRIFNSTKCSHDFIIGCKQIGIGDMAQYQRESQELSYNKLCMIQIDNSDLLLTHFGGTGYFAHLQKAVKEIYEYVDKFKLNNILLSYVMDNATFLVAGDSAMSEDYFVTHIKKLYDHFQFMTPFKTDIPILFRFVLVLNQPHMLECAIEAMIAKRNAQKCFIICEKKQTVLADTERELNMISILQWAIRNNSVVPYYQGLYDNQTGGINKYESLMRIVDANGTVYVPADFMEIAKKYHLYAKLSKMMIRRVLQETDEKPIAVSINLSAYDINSVDFRNELFYMLKKRTSKELLVFEILEDEAFEEPEILREFVIAAKKMGSQIAIDDFGSGYSNLLEIARINPEYLKIDGGIIERINECPRSRGVFESVLYLAKKIGTKTVAEHVENVELQHSLEQYSVDFSQGFCMSRPLPMSDLQLMIDANKGMII